MPLKLRFVTTRPDKSIKDLRDAVLNNAKENWKELTYGGFDPKGSESYWASYAETAIGVDPAPEPYPDYPEILAPTTDLVILAAVIIAIIIGAVSVYITRKQRK